MLETLVNKIKSKDALIGIVGLGYVGLPLLLRFAEVGFRVVGIDIDESKTTQLSNAQSYISHIDCNRLEAVKEKTMYTTDFSKASECDALIICVPTPLNKYREPDLGYVLTTVDSLSPYLRGGQIMSLESTTYPGTTDEELMPRVEKQGLKVGQDFFLIYSPEREDPANGSFNTASIPKVCGGVTAACLEVGKSLYNEVINTVVPVSSTRAAEMTKLLENIHRSVNIGLVNEMKILADKMDLDIFEVIDAAATKPFGFVAYYPGPGIGGHCIPVDPFYLTWKAREWGLHTRFIELAGEINGGMPQWVTQKTSAALNEHSKSVKGSKVLILGVAYKANVDDLRESPSLVIMKLLQERGAKISYSDPHFDLLPKLRNYDFKLKNTELSINAIKLFDCIILATAHEKFDYSLLAKNAQLIIDTRGAFRHFNQDNIIDA